MWLADARSCMEEEMRNGYLQTTNSRASPKVLNARSVFQSEAIDLFMLIPRIDRPRCLPHDAGRAILMLIRNIATKRPRARMSRFILRLSYGEP